MSVLSLPPEILLVVFESEVLTREDLRNARLACSDFEKAAGSRLFSSLSVDLVAENRRSHSQLRRIHDLADPPPILPRLPRSIQLLSITLPDNDDEDYASFLEGCGKHFLSYFEHIRCLKLDVRMKSDAFSTVFSETSDFLQTIMTTTARIGRVELRAHYVFLLSLNNIPLSSLAPIFHKAKGNRSDWLADPFSASTAVAEAIVKSPIPLERLDMSSARELELVGFCFWEIISKTPLALVGLRSLVLSTPQLPDKNRDVVASLQSLEKLELIDRDDTDDLQDGYFAPQEVFWRILRNFSIKLRSITVPALSQPLLDYIAVCGEKLRVLEITTGDVIVDGSSYSFFRQDEFWNDQMEAIAERFRKETLPSLSDHLKRFSLAVQLLGSGNEGWQLGMHTNGITSNEFSLGSYLITGSDYFPESSPPIHDRLSGLMKLIIGMKKLSEVDLSIEGWSTVGDVEEPVLRNGLIMAEQWKYPYDGGERLWKEGMKLFISWGCQGDLKDDAYKLEHPLYRTDYELLLWDNNRWRFDMLRKYYHDDEE